MENKVKWGILGTANVAAWGMIPGMKKASDTELVAIAGRDPGKTKRYSDQFGIRKTYLSYDELINDSEISAVYIPLPNDLHMPWVIKALKSGKHVLCEKPLALSSDEVKKMFLTAQECGVYLMEAYAYLHSPYVESLKKDIQSGIIGDIDYIDTAFVTQGYKDDFRLRKEPGGGAMYDLGCYCTTMILSLIDSGIKTVNAVSEFSDLGVDLLTTGYIGFQNGARASFNVGMILGEDTNSRYDRLYIHGTKGSIRSDVEYNMEGLLRYKIFTEDGEIERAVEADNNYSLEIEQFNRCIKGYETPHVSSDFSIRNAELIDTVLKKIGY